MRVVLRKSVADKICRYWGFPLVQKAVRDPKFEYFKRKILEHLDKLERKERAQMRKSLAYLERLEKAQKREVGDIVTWGRKVKHEYIKGADGKWRRYYRGTSRGQKLSIAALKRKVDACKDVGELWDLVFANWGRFMDADKMPLPVVRELHAYASKREDEINAGVIDKPRPERRGKKKLTAEEGATKPLADMTDKELDEFIQAKEQEYKSARGSNNEELVSSINQVLRNANTEERKRQHSKMIAELADEFLECKLEDHDPTFYSGHLCRLVASGEEEFFNNDISKDNPLEISPSIFLAGDTFDKIYTNSEGDKYIEDLKQQRAEELKEYEQKQAVQDGDPSVSMADIEQRKTQAENGGVEKIVANFPKRGGTRLALGDIKMLFDRENKNPQLAALFDKVYGVIEAKVDAKDFNAKAKRLDNTTLGSANPSSIFYNSNLYKLEQNAQGRARVFLHELIHYTTMSALQDYEEGNYDKLNEEQKQACETLFNMYKYLARDKHLAGAYGLKSVYEMVAELSNERFREKLKKKNLWTVIVDAVAKIVGVFKKGCKAASALETAEGALYKLLDNYKRNYISYIDNTDENARWISFAPLDEKLPNDKDFKAKKWKLRKHLAQTLKPYLGKWHRSYNITVGSKDEKKPLEAYLNSDSLGKLGSDKAIEKTVLKNKFSLEEHFEAAEQIIPLFKNATLVETRPDKKGDTNIVSIKRLKSPFVFKSGKKAVAYITLKESIQNGHKIYSIEVLDIKEAAVKNNQQLGADESNPVQRNSNIPQPPKNASEKSLHPSRCRFVVRKSVARAILRQE